MPSRNVVKNFIKGGIYHVYNRGVNRQSVFSDKKDYRIFLSYTREYLLSVPPPYKVFHAGIKNYHSLIKLLAYCLMPNHVHLLLQQSEVTSLTRFMQSITTRYTRYYNKRHDRSGPLFQGTYKAVLIESDEQLLHVSRYIHRNPVNVLEPVFETEHPLHRQPSSYPVYIGMFDQTWVDTDIVLSHFSNSGKEGYKGFVEDSSFGTEERMVSTIKDIALDGSFHEG